MKSKSHNFVDAMRQDISAERLLQKIPAQGYGENFKGCWIGCVLRQYDHKKMAKTLEWPLTLVRISEQIFEGMKKEDAQVFAVEVLDAPKPNSDLSLVPWKFLHQMVVQTLDRHADEKIKEACSAAVNVLLRKSEGKNVSLYEARTAADAADAADAYAAAAAAYAAADADAYAAAAAAAYAADAYAAKQDRYKELGDMLLAIMRDA